MRAKLKLFPVLLVVFGLILAQGVPGTTQAALAPQAAAFSISGRVTDESGTGIEGVTIRAVLNSFQTYLPNISKSGDSSQVYPPVNPPTFGGNFFTTETDTDGNYIFTNLPTGRYFIQAFKAGVDFNPLSYTLSSTTGGSQYNFVKTTIPTIYSPNANPLSESTTSQISSISEDGLIITFSTETPELAQVDVGEIITGGSSVVAPEGFLRRVLSKQYQGDAIVLETEPATLEDAYESLSVNISRDLTPADLEGITPAPGIKLIESRSSMEATDEPITFFLDNYILDKDHDPSTTDDQIAFNGFIHLFPHAEFRIRIEGSDLQEYYQNIEMTIQTGYTVTSGSSMSLAREETIFEKKAVLSTAPLITLKFDVFVGFSGTISGGTSTGITNTTVFTKGAWFSNGQKQEWGKFENFPSPTQTGFENTLSFKAYVGTQLQFRAFDLFGPYIEASIGLKLDITHDPQLNVKLQIGLEISGGISASVEFFLKFTFFDWQFTGIEWWYLIFSYPDPINNEPYRPHNPIPAPNASNLDLSSQLTWEGGDPNGDLVVYDIYFNAGTNPPTTMVADHQDAVTFDPGSLAANTTYYWQVVAFDQHALSTLGPVWHFTTGSGGALPGAFDKIFPSNVAVNQPTSLTLDWADSSGATDYSYCYDMTDNNTCSNWTSSGTTSQASISGLSTTSTYYWQVRATNSTGDTYANGSPTAFWSFTTGGGTVIPGEMVTIPAGSFSMGCDPNHNGGYSCYSDELPLHTITLDAYRIDKFEVTNAQYAQCVAAGNCSAPSSNASYTRSSYYNNPIYANYPVIYVSWQDATNYCAWAGKRLPTEAEWEKAARGTSVIAYPWGDASPTCSLVNGYINGYCVGDTSAVGDYPAGASPYGAMDMAGNVWEWVNDWYSSSYYSISPSSNPQGPASGAYRVLRGGSWGNYGYDLRVADRRSSDPTTRSSYFGFRCAAPPGN